MARSNESHHTDPAGYVKYISAINILLGMLSTEPSTAVHRFLKVCGGAAPELTFSAGRGRWPVLLDHLVGAGEQRSRDVEAESLRRLEVDHQLELGWQLHRQVAG